MLIARGTPRAILIGGTAAALIIAVSVSLRAAPLQALWAFAPTSDHSAPLPAPVAATVPSTEMPTVTVAMAAPSAAASPDSIDDIITGSISPAAKAAPASVTGSTAFVAALDLISSGKAADAFTAAQSLPDDLERRVAEWGAIYYGNGAVPYDAVRHFMAEAPDFVSSGVFKTRIEQALLKADAPGDLLIKTIGGSTPNTLDAQLALAQAYLAANEKERAAALARSIWLNDDLGAGDETRVLTSLGSLLTNKDHWRRAEHLMMADQAGAVDRMLKLLTPAQKTLAVARIAVSRNQSGAAGLLDKVDASLKTNPIYYFSRAELAHQGQRWDDAIAYLNKGQANDPDAEDWWYERRNVIHDLLAAGDAQRAFKVAADYTAGPEGRLVEARFHAGWIALSFLHDPKTAVKQFETMVKLSTLPDSVTQAEYWLGRARAGAGDLSGAKAAYQVAAGYGTLYYGLLSRAALGLRPVELRGLPDATASESTFQNRELVKAINLLMADGKNDMAGVLLRLLAPSLKSGGELVLAARLAQKIDAHHLAISIADIADKRGVPLDVFSFPKDGLPTTKLADIDMAAIYAITRTESRFQVDAVSSSGAKGLMQLMPATAKETAQKIGVAYSPKKLTSDPEYNALLGSSYLASQLQTYGGSLVLAAAAYNAGAGNANKWITLFGDPRAANVDPVLWVELIPFQETRRYVQRVLGNYLVYRARLGLAPIDPVTALHSIAG